MLANVVDVEGWMTTVKRTTLVGAVAMVGLALVLVGVSGLSNPEPADAAWQEEKGARLFTNDRVDESEQDAQVDSTNSTEQSKEPDTFSVVDDQSWAFQAIKSLSADKLPSLEGHLDGGKPVTRYELAVIIARLFEKYQGTKGVVQVPLEKLALLEKLSAEFRDELKVLGIKQSRFSGRLTRLERKMGSIDKQMKEATGEAREAIIASEASADEARKAADTAKTVVESVKAEMAGVSSKVETSEERLQKVSNILSRILVKVALNDTRLQDLTGGKVDVHRRDMGSMARAVAQLQTKVAGLRERQSASLQRYDTLSQSIERVATDKQSQPVIASAAGLSEEDRRQLRLTRELVTRLHEKVKFTQATLQLLQQQQAHTQALAKQSRNNQGVQPEALAEVKGILKGFLGTFERRLQMVERRAM